MVSNVNFDVQPVVTGRTVNMCVTVTTTSHVILRRGSAISGVPREEWGTAAIKVKVKERKRFQCSSLLQIVTFYHFNQFLCGFFFLLSFLIVIFVEKNLVLIFVESNFMYVLECVRFFSPCFLFLLTSVQFYFAELMLLLQLVPMEHLVLTVNRHVIVTVVFVILRRESAFVELASEEDIAINVSNQPMKYDLPVPGVLGHTLIDRRIL